MLKPPTSPCITNYFAYYDENNTAPHSRYFRNWHNGKMPENSTKNNKNPQFTYSKIWQSLKQRNSSSILDNA